MSHVFTLRPAVWNHLGVTLNTSHVMLYHNGHSLGTNAIEFIEPNKTTYTLFSIKHNGETGDYFIYLLK